MKKYLSKGFTLVELLIVIALLGAIALIVIAAINPIEQTNRARDARFKADSAQLLSAIDRYYASHSKFPWEGCLGASCTTTSEDPFDFVSAEDDAVGLCGDSSCSSQGLLITSQELKNAFLSRDWITDTTGAEDKKIYVGKASGSSSSVYTCFVPLAKSNRDKAIEEEKVRSKSFDTNGVPAATTLCATSSVDWSTLGCYVCVPE
ncbi:type II secretion system protein [Patescibacteria group bacterium]